MAAMKNRTAGLWILVGLSLLVLMASGAFGATFPVRPSAYELILSRPDWCDPFNTIPVLILDWGLQGDVRWRELYQPSPDGKASGPLRAIATYEPGERGRVIDVWISLPSGDIRVFHGAEAIRGSGFEYLCDVIQVWRNQT